MTKIVGGIKQNEKAWKVKFAPKIRKKVELILWKPNAITKISKDILIKNFDKENLHFIDSEWKNYKVWKILRKLYNIDNDKDMTLIEAVIGSLLYEVGETNDPELIEEIYDWKAKSCMQGKKNVAQIWIKSFWSSEYMVLKYVYNDEKEYIWRIVINKLDKEGWEIYTENDKKWYSNTYCYALLKIILKDYYLATTYDNSYDLNYLDSISPEYKNEKDLYNGFWWGKEWLQEVYNKYEFNGIATLIKKNIISLEKTNQFFWDIYWYKYIDGKNIYTVKKIKYIIFDIYSNFIIHTAGNSNIRNIIELDWYDNYIFLDLDNESLKKFRQEYKDNIIEDPELMSSGHFDDFIDENENKD